MLKLRLLALVVVALIVVMQYRLWVSEDGLPAIQRLSEKIDAQGEENKRLRTRNDRLEAEVRDLKAGLEAVEERARRELGMIADDETFYQFVEPPRAEPFRPAAPAGSAAPDDAGPSPANPPAANLPAHEDGSAAAEVQ